MATHSESTQATRRNRSYVAAAMDRPLLTQEREFELAQRWREDGDEKALHELVSAYLRLVVSIAGRFRQYGLPIGDLVQEGNVGLMQAAARFEPSREVRFSTYASWWIRSAMQEFVLRNWSIVPNGTSAAQKTLFFNLRRLRAELEPAGTVAISNRASAEIAGRLRVSERLVNAMAERLSGYDFPLYSSIGRTGENEWVEFFIDSAPTPEEAAIRHCDGDVEHRWLAAALESLTDRERLIIRARWLQEGRVTLEDIGARLGITKERVRQIEHRAFSKLKKAVLNSSWTTRLGKTLPSETSAYTEQMAPVPNEGRQDFATNHRGTESLWSRPQRVQSTRPTP
jgi:RNA polymerase sigma-32 factor